MGKHSIIVGGVTFFLFTSEAVIHYNMGVQKETGSTKFTLPPKKDLVSLIIVVGAFSVLNGVIINLLTKS